MATDQQPQQAMSIDELLTPAPRRPGEAFTTAFRGYDRDEVDQTVGMLAARQRADAQRVTQLDQQHRDDQAEASRSAQRIQELEAELKVARAKATQAEKHVRTLTGELSDASARGDGDRSRFEEVLRVAEEQASIIIKNASVQGERLILAANEDIAKRKTEAKADAEAVVARARHDAQQARLRIDTEAAAHEATLERQAAHAAERVSQADQEAATVRTEAERAAAALRALVTRETDQQRAQAEEAVREMRLRALEFEESLTRRQDDAQQEFLMLHNQAVAHAERITQDANDQVAASIEHAQRVSTKAADFDRVMRAQAAQIEAEAHSRAGETLERARTKAQRIIDTVTGHSQSVLRDAEDRARVLRWQGQQLSSFMAEVHELIRPDGIGEFDDEPAVDAQTDADRDAPAEEQVDESAASDDAGVSSAAPPTGAAVDAPPPVELTEVSTPPRPRTPRAATTATKTTTAATRTTTTATTPKRARPTS